LRDFREIASWEQRPCASGAGFGGIEGAGASELCEEGEEVLFFLLLE
jgi:hypothetical protein